MKTAKENILKEEQLKKDNSLKELANVYAS